MHVTATINGEKGKTAEFWMKYVHLIHVYQEYSRDLCDGDLRDYMSSINRTTKPFSKNPIALTLEQTVNADTASQRTGNASMTNSISAGQRWAEYHRFLRTRLKSSKKGRHYRKSESFKYKQR